MSTGIPLLALPEDQPVIVAGRPGALRTNLPFADPGAAPVILRDATARLEPAKDGVPPPVVRASLVAVLQPGQATSVSLRLDIDPQTPPGTYHGDIELAGTTRRLELTVVEHVRLAIDPSPILLDRAAGTTLRKTVLFRNLGNVSLHIELPSPVGIGVELSLAATATVTVGSSGRPGQAITDLFGRLFEARDRHVVEEVGAMRLNLPQGGFDLAPGATRSAEVECILPDDLTPERRYHARAPVYDQDLVFVVVTTSHDDARTPRRDQERSPDIDRRPKERAPPRRRKDAAR
jgi:hypothetical protein